MNVKEIAVRAGVTAGESFLGAVLATGMTGVSIEGAQFAALAALGAGLSVVYNALRSWLDRSASGPGDDG